MRELHLPRRPLQADITLPASKSISNRALILNALAYSPYDIDNLSDCDDTRVLARALDSNDTRFDIGAAGTAMRFLTALLAKTFGEWTITGNERMKQRPIGPLVDALNTLGGKIEYPEKEGFPPLKIFGSALTGGAIHLDGSLSSQYVSALMMIAPYMRDGLTLTLDGTIVSRPYIRMTADMMRAYGAEVSCSGNIIDIRPQSYRPRPFSVEADWSAASYWYELLCLAGAGRVTLRGLRPDSCQGDARVAELFARLGIHTAHTAEGVLLTLAGKPASDTFSHDFTDEPDLAQTLTVTCCLKDIPFRFSGLHSLRLKETDRIAALLAETRKLGYVLHTPADGLLCWDGTRCPADGHPVIATHGDHRMAMSFAPAALVRPLAIEQPEVVSKSYPAFWDELEKACLSRSL